MHILSRVCLSFFIATDKLTFTLKFFGTYPRISEKIRTGSKRTRDAFNLARTYQEYVAPDWHKNVIVTVKKTLT